MRLPGGFHVGADAAVVEQVDRRLEDGADEFVGRECFLLDSKDPLRFDRYWDGFRAAREDAAAPGDELRVVVGPGGARQLEEALAFAMAFLGVGRGVEEDVAVVERRHELDVTREQHAVAEHVARHVADPGHREVDGLRIDAELAKVALHRFPCAARRDRHLLVVVARRAARGERVAEPEAVFRGDGVGGVGEGRGSLVGGDHQVGIVAVVAQHSARRHHFAVDPVVGDVEQAAQEGLVAGDAFLHQRLALAGGRLLEHESALGPDRHDDHVLHHLRLHQAQHLGAEVLHAVRPADAAARDHAAAQVHCLDARRVDPDLEHRPRLGQARHALRIELERDVRFRHEKIGASGRLDHGEEAAQDAVLVEVLHRVERGGDLACQRLFVLFLVFSKS